MGDRVSEREIEGKTECQSWRCVAPLKRVDTVTGIVVLLVVIAATAVAHADGTTSTS